MLVTGGGGFIGSNLVERLVRDGHRVRVLDNFATGRRENLSPVLDDVELVEGDIQSYERVAHARSAAASSVFHQAALPSVPRSIPGSAHQHHASNVTGTLNVLLAGSATRAVRPRRLRDRSSVGLRRQPRSCRSASRWPALPDRPVRGLRKLSGRGLLPQPSTEVYGLETGRRFATSTSSGRGRTRSPSTPAVIPRASSRRYARGRARPVVYGDGEQSRDFSYCRQRGRGEPAWPRDSEGVGVASPSTVACRERIAARPACRWSIRELTGPARSNAEYQPARPGSTCRTLSPTCRVRAEHLSYEPAGRRSGNGLSRTFDYFRGSYREIGSVAFALATGRQLAGVDISVRCIRVAPHPRPPHTMAGS